MLGVNSYFQGSDASDIAVRADLKANSNLLMVGKLVNGKLVENGAFKADDKHQTSAVAMLDELARWTKALHALRQP